MGIKKFFKKVGGWVKDKFHKAKNVVSKFVKPVVKVAKKVVNFVDKTPLGPILSRVSGGIFDGVKKVINILPDGEVKNNVQNFANKAESTAGQVVSKVENVQNKAQGLINKGRDLFDRGKQAAEIFKQFKQRRIQPKPNM
jgi:phage-related protein